MNISTMPGGPGHWEPKKTPADTDKPKRKRRRKPSPPKPQPEKQPSDRVLQ